MSALLDILKHKEDLDSRFDIPCPMLREHECSERFCLMDTTFPEVTLITFDKDSVPVSLMNGKFPNFCLNLITDKDGYCFCPTKQFRIKIMDEFLHYDEYVEYLNLAKQVGILTAQNTDCSLCLHKLIYQVKKGKL
ncbi:MAG: hypothetical protein ACTSP4_07925 [Candidatus Hodarchaeales archaeon]